MACFLMNEMAMKQNNLAPSDYIQDAIDAIRTEQRALELLIDELDERFVNACQTILNCSGRVVVTGMGKSGHIGRKITATFASTGTPAFLCTLERQGMVIWECWYKAMYSLPSQIRANQMRYACCCLSSNNSTFH